MISNCENSITDNGGNHVVGQVLMTETAAPAPTVEHTDQHESQSEASTGNPDEEPQTCIRLGCTNQAVNNAEWENEYCSNECVVTHCRDVFSSWIQTNQNEAVK